MGRHRFFFRPTTKKTKNLNKKQTKSKTKKIKVKKSRFKIKIYLKNLTFNVKEKIIVYLFERTDLVSYFFLFLAICY